MKLLLDTNAHAHLRRGAPDVADKARSAREIVMSTIVLGEVLYGFRHGSRTEAPSRGGPRRRRASPMRARPYSSRNSTPNPGHCSL